MGSNAAREMLKRLSLYNSFLGGAQFGIQLALSALRHFLILATPFTGGLSLAPAAPVALAQAALAVHTTKVTGRLAAKVFLNGKQRSEIQPRAMIKRLAQSDPGINYWLSDWLSPETRESNKLQTILP